MAAQLWLNTPTVETSTSGRSAEYKKGETPNPQEFARMFPTPNARDWKDSMNTVPPSVGKTRGHSLGQAVADVKLFPTPQAGDYRSLNRNPGNQGNSKILPQSAYSLPAIVAAMLPTPTARMYKSARSTDALARSGRTPSNSLEDTVAAMYPTPTTGAGLCGGTGNYQQLQRLRESGVITEDERRNMSQGNGGQLNPTWVEWLMGFPFGWTDIDLLCASPGRVNGWWDAEPDVPRVAVGVKDRVNRLKCLGNAVVPYQVYPIFKAIAEIEAAKE